MFFMAFELCFLANKIKWILLANKTIRIIITYSIDFVQGAKGFLIGL